MLRRKIVASLASAQSTGKKRVPIGIDRSTFTLRKRKFGSKVSSAVRNAGLKAVRRCLRYRAGQGWPSRLCAFCGSLDQLRSGSKARLGQR